MNPKKIIKKFIGCDKASKDMKIKAEVEALGSTWQIDADIKKVKK